MATEKRKCPVCHKGTLARETRKDKVSYKGHSITIDQPGDWCNKCGEAVLTGADMKVTERAIRDLHAGVEGLLTSGEIKAIRLKMKLSQKDLAIIFGGGPNGFSRYERGETLQTRATDNLLRLLEQHPTLLREIPRYGDLGRKTRRSITPKGRVLKRPEGLRARG